MTCESGLSCSSEVQLALSPSMKQLMAIKSWVESDAGLNGRTDDEFLLMFLRSCEFDMELTKFTMRSYYESRRDIPQWWANRNIKDDKLSSLLPYGTTIALMDGDVHQPSVIVTTFSRYGPNLNNFDDYVKLGSIVMETVVRRRNCQMNGVIWILDCRDYKWWIGFRLLNPIFSKKFAYSFYQSMPMRMKSVILLNAPAIAATSAKLFQKFLPPSIKGRIHTYGSDWSRIDEHVPLELLPEEYGGQAGPMEKHDDAFIEEMLSFNEYLVDDNKYGFQ